MKMRALILGLVLASCGGKPSQPASASAALRQAAPNELLAVADFDAIGDRKLRSRALFSEAAPI